MSKASKGYELGGDPYTFPWLRSVDKMEYNGEPPFIFIEYLDKDLPVEIRLEAFSSFIPNDIKNSSLPLAFFLFKVKNKLKEEVEFSLLAGLKNPFGEIPAEAEISSDKLKNSFSLAIKGVNAHKNHYMDRGSITLGFIDDGEYGYSLAAPYEERKLRHKWVEFRGTGLLRDNKRSIRAEERHYSN